MGKVLSASRISTFEKCSWSYWCNYHLKVPQHGNDGANRGTVCHLVFELLLRKKHKHHFDSIIKDGTVINNKAVVRLVEKNLRKLKAYNEGNFDLCMKMILVGLNHEFYGNGSEIEEPVSELEFLLESKNPEYKIRGYIDKVFKYEDKVKIVDYKSSKKKFKGEELSANLQAMAYTLASKKQIFKNIKDVEVEFLFLKFPRQPAQQVIVTDEQLNGFEHYLEHVYKLINNFSVKEARSNFASDNPNTRWMCKAGATWQCPYYEEVEYFALKDEYDDTLKTAFKKEDLPKVKKGQRIVKLKYEGCPAHSYARSSTPSDEDDDDIFNI